MAYEDDVKNFRGNMRMHTGGVRKPEGQKPKSAGSQHGGGKSGEHKHAHGHEIHKKEGGGYSHTVHHSEGPDEHEHENYDEAEQHGREEMGVDCPECNGESEMSDSGMTA